MNFREFEEVFRNQLVISLNEIMVYDLKFHSNRLTEWQREGLIVKIKNGWYVRKSSIETLNYFKLFCIANRVYSPSYISLGSALSYYNLIPEGMGQISSISSLKTADIRSKVGNFSYRSIKPEMLTGYKVLGEGLNKFCIAYKEKALVDYLYLNSYLQQDGDMHEIRINQKELWENFSEDRFWQYVAIAGNKQLEKRAKLFLSYWRNPTYAQF
ncbi:MAG: hypothetical protein M3P33_00600 [bacterium]|nr:hypothetical protein [bacterium]